MKLIIELNEQDTEYDDFLSNADTKITILADGANIVGAHNHMWKLEADTCKYTTHELAVDGQIHTFSMDIDMLYSGSYTDPFQITVKNLQADYLAT